jgi:two-component system, OmpR family, sensor kinase
VKTLGRLFWKFFFFFWLAQAVIFVGVVALVWMWPDILRVTGGGPPEALVKLISPPPDLQGISSRLSLPPPVPLVAGVFVGLLFAASLSWYFSRPIRSLQQAFTDLSAGKLDTRIGSAMGKRRDELSDLGRAFDHSAAKLQALVESQQRLLHSTSHELRSPLARLQACAELMVQQPARAVELVERIERETNRMDRLVGELLTLARLDSGTNASPHAPVDLVELATDLREDATPELEASRCSLTLQAPPELLIHGDGELLYRAIDNVVRNAMRHAVKPGEVVITLTRHEADSVAHLQVSDNGPGIPDKDLESIFDPFFRRHAAEHPDGYGLGLTIARSIIAAHGGSVTAHNRPEGGLAVTFTLPMPLAGRA